MSLPSQFLVKYSDMKVNDVDITPYFREVQIEESIFSPFIRGCILVEDTPSTRTLLTTGTLGGPETYIDFTFSGYQGEDRTEQSPIEINNKNYLIYHIVHPGIKTEGKTQLLELHFIHKSFFSNYNLKLSEAFSNLSISNIVKTLGKNLNLKWNDVEETKNNITTCLTFDNVVSHILNLTKYAIRKENINDVNFLFWQNIKGEHNFNSISKMFSQPSTFGNDVFSGFLYTNYSGFNYEINRRLVMDHVPINAGTIESAFSGAYTSGMLFLDNHFNNGFKYINYDIKNEWKKQTHLNSMEFIDNKSSFWDSVNGPFSTRIYCTPRHTFCCNEKEGGQRNEIFCAPRRNSQLSQLFQLGIQFKSSGNTNTDEVSAGKIVYFGRPIVSNVPENSKQEDIFYSGKYLITTIKHVIQREATANPKYFCKINCYKDSIGEE